MPEEAPEECVGEEARQVAEYIHKQFYSRKADSGTRRLALARLTRIIHQCWATSRKSFSSREVQRSYLEHRAEAGNY
jgi:hypothetical protein